MQPVRLKSRTKVKLLTFLKRSLAILSKRNTIVTKSISAFKKFSQLKSTYGHRDGCVNIS